MMTMRLISLDITLMMKMVRFLYSILLTITVAYAISAQVGGHPKQGEQWRALHLIGYETDSDLDALGQDIPKLAELGVNVLILEVDYSFNFQSHPELRKGKNPITKSGARHFSETCRKSGIRLIPEFQSLGHQPWAAETFPL